MDRKRIRDEVVEIMAHKLYKLPALNSDAEFDYEIQVIKPDITDNPLDIAEVTMDMEDAFGVNFDELMPGDKDMETIGKVVDFLVERIERNHPGPNAKPAAAPAKPAPAPAKPAASKQKKR